MPLTAEQLERLVVLTEKLSYLNKKLAKSTMDSVNAQSLQRLYSDIKRVHEQLQALHHETKQ